MLVTWLQGQQQPHCKNHFINTVKSQHYGALNCQIQQRHSCSPQDKKTMLTFSNLINFKYQYGTISILVSLCMMMIIFQNNITNRLSYKSYLDLDVLLAILYVMWASLPYLVSEHLAFIIDTIINTRDVIQSLVFTILISMSSWLSKMVRVEKHHSFMYYTIFTSSPFLWQHPCF